MLNDLLAIGVILREKKPYSNSIKFQTKISVEKTMKRKGNINPSRKIYFDAIQLRNKIKELPFAMTRHCKDHLSIMLCHLMNVIVANSINNILALEPY